MNWRCDYCGRENEANRLTCAGCQAGKPERESHYYASYGTANIWTYDMLGDCCADEAIADAMKFELKHVADGTLYIGGAFSSF